MNPISVTQQRLGGHDDQRLAELAVQLAAQHVVVAGRGGAVDHLDVVLAAELQEAFRTRRGVLGPLALVAMGQQHDQARHAQPLGFARDDELVDDDLGAVGEVAELRLPEHQRARFGE